MWLPTVLGPICHCFAMTLFGCHPSVPWTSCSPWADARSPTIPTLIWLDRTPPIVAAADVEDIDGGTVIVRPLVVPPEISTVRFIWGAPDKVNCASTHDFQDLRRDAYP